MKEANKVKRLRWIKAFAPTAQMFHGLGKGLGRGRGPRLARVPATETSERNTDRGLI